MNRNAGLWIDHKQAVIVFAATDAHGIAGAEETNHIESGMEKDVRFSGHAASEGPAEDQRDHQFATHFDQYYDDVIVHLHEAKSILIFGPGEAKGEFKKRLAHKGSGERIVGVETTGKMTDNQIVAKVLEYYEQ